ncbi:hypothetical protein [Accumulibacter sp.]|uniref:hypothetical protein n=1 Tax=Accumulibacter sp. TaxID=2053492 RepID=UPI002616E42F|nr:hypothetical protein [Accumulibacter sp.]
MRHNSLIIAAVAAALLPMPAAAQFAAGMQSGMGQGMYGTGPGSTGMGAGMHGGKRHQAMHGPADCSKSANPEQCAARQEAHRKVFEACKDQVGSARRQCMQEQAQKTDCTQARDAQQCQARKQAYAACASQSGAKFPTCVQQRLPSAACSTATDAALCAQHEKARTLCANRNGPDHLQCLRDVLAPGK